MSFGLRLRVIRAIGGDRLDPATTQSIDLSRRQPGSNGQGQGIGRAQDLDRSAHWLDPVNAHLPRRFGDEPGCFQRRHWRLRSRRDHDAWRGKQSAIVHGVDGVNPIMVDLIGIEVTIDRMIKRRRNALAVSRVPGRTALLADHPNVGSSARQCPGQLDLMVVQLDTHVLDVGQKNKRAQRDCADGLDAAPLAQDSVTGACRPAARACRQTHWC